MVSISTMVLTISIHVPLAGDDQIEAGQTASFYVFLSTSPLRGTTHYGYRWYNDFTISIHVPLAGDDPDTEPVLPAIYISIHVPLAGDDSNNNSYCCPLHHFYPRPPCGGRRVRPAWGRTRFSNFYPRPPCGGRPATAFWYAAKATNFYPRPPCGGRRRAAFRRFSAA